MSARSPNRLFSAAGLAVLLVAAPAHAALPDGLSGAWYNPAQSGHGLSISLVDEGRRAAVIWHVYDPAGAPLTLYVDGVVQGREITGLAFAPRGMRFGVFDPDSIDLPVWGEVVLRFADCGNATLSWQAQAAGYADGSMAIVPLAPIGSLPCTLPPENPLRPGLYTAEPAGTGMAIVDGEGRFWGASASAGRMWPRAPFDPVTELTLGEVTAVEGAQVAMRFLLQRGGVFARQAIASSDAAGAVVLALPEGIATPSQRWAFGAPAGTMLQAPVDLPTLAGEYRLPYELMPGAPREGQIAVAADGSLCARYEPAAGTACDIAGQLSTPEGDAGLVDFVLYDRRSAPRIPYRGRGWLAWQGGERRLTLVGSDGDLGFLLIGS